MKLCPRSREVTLRRYYRTGKMMVRTCGGGESCHWQARDPDDVRGLLLSVTADEVFYRHELEVSGDLAFCRFGTELTLCPRAGGTPTKMTLQGIHVYRRRPSGWKFKVVIAIGVGNS